MMLTKDSHQGHKRKFSTGQGCRLWFEDRTSCSSSGWGHGWMQVHYVVAIQSKKIAQRYPGWLRCRADHRSTRCQDVSSVNKHLHSSYRSCSKHSFTISSALSTSGFICYTPNLFSHSTPGLPLLERIGRDKNPMGRKETCSQSYAPWPQQPELFPFQEWLDLYSLYCTWGTAD